MLWQTIRILVTVGAKIPGKENGFDIEGLAVYQDRFSWLAWSCATRLGCHVGNRARDEQLRAVEVKANGQEKAVQKSILFTCMAWEFRTCVWMVKTC